MATSWTAGVWTLLAALGLLSVCRFGYCEASRTTSPTSGGRKEDHGPSSLERVKRGWVWNQFFVVEEYTGTEPLYVGKVRRPFYYYHSCVSGAFLKAIFWTSTFRKIAQKVPYLTPTNLDVPQRPRCVKYSRHPRWGKPHKILRNVDRQS